MENQCKKPKGEEHYLPMGTPWLGGECPLCVQEERDTIRELCEEMVEELERISLVHNKTHPSRICRCAVCEKNQKLIARFRELVKEERC